MISEEQVARNWKSLVGAVKQKYGELSGDELTKVGGNIEQLVALVQRKSGAAKEQISEFVNTFMRSAGTAIEVTVDKASEWAGAASEVISDNYGRMSAEAQRGYEYSVDTVRRKPLESVAIAVGAGVLAGIAIGISMCSRRRY